jgi:hypothetical protein
VGVAVAVGFHASPQWTAGRSSATVSATKWCQLVPGMSCWTPVVPTATTQTCRSPVGQATTDQEVAGSSPAERASIFAGQPPILARARSLSSFETILVHLIAHGHLGHERHGCTHLAVAASGGSGVFAGSAAQGRGGRRRRGPVSTSATCCASGWSRASATAAGSSTSASRRATSSQPVRRIAPCHRRVRGIGAPSRAGLGPAGAAAPRDAGPHRAGGAAGRRRSADAPATRVRELTDRRTANGTFYEMSDGRTPRAVI